MASPDELRQQVENLKVPLDEVRNVAQPLRGCAFPAAHEIWHNRTPECISKPVPKEMSDLGEIRLR